MTLESKTVELCLALGVDKATRVQTAFLKKYADKYFMECFEGRITVEQYNFMGDRRLEKYIGLYLSHYQNNIPKRE